MKTSLALAALAVVLPALPLSANEFAAQLTALAEGELAAFVADPAVIEAVAAANAETAALAQADIDALEAEWAAAGPLVDTTLGRPLSAHLNGLLEAGGGLYTEIFAMDAMGLNVGQTSMTSDYWQGDEDKHSVPMSTGAAHIGDVEFDESSQTYQAQVSLPVTDPAAGTVIGAVTFGVNVEILAQ